ncbi:MAG: acyltransferase [Myxococcales bacterium]
MATMVKNVERLSEAESAPASAAKRVTELDLLRGVAIVLVLATHSPSERGESGWLRPLDAFIHQFGWTGVDLFFVLSGYLIGGLLFSEIRKFGSLDVRRFVLRRMLRIWPAYYLCLAFAFFIFIVREGFTPSAAWEQLWPSLLNIQNFFGGGPRGRDQLWSLGVEEHFYLALPLYLGLLARKADRLGTSRLVPLTGLVLGVVCLGLRVYTYVIEPTRLRYPTYLCLDALFFGVVLAYFKAYRSSVLQSIANAGWSLPVALLSMVPAALFPGFVRETVGFTGLYLGYGLILLKLIYRPRQGTLVDRVAEARAAGWLAAFGTSSYSIYLWHREFWTWEVYLNTLALGQRLHLPRELTWFLHTVLYMVAGAVTGIVFDRLLEQPIMNLRNRWFPARDTPAVENRNPAAFEASASAP